MARRGISGKHKNIAVLYWKRIYIYIEQLAMETIGTIHSWSTWTYMEGRSAELFDKTKVTQEPQSLMCKITFHVAVPKV